MWAIPMLHLIQAKWGQGLMGLLKAGEWARDEVRIYCSLLVLLYLWKNAEKSWGGDRAPTYLRNSEGNRNESISYSFIQKRTCHTNLIALCFSKKCKSREQLFYIVWTGFCITWATKNWRMEASINVSSRTECGGGCGACCQVKIRK